MSKKVIPEKGITFGLVQCWTSPKAIKNMSEGDPEVLIYVLVFLADRLRTCFGSPSDLSNIGQVRRRSLFRGSLSDNICLLSSPLRSSPVGLPFSSSPVRCPLRTLLPSGGENTLVLQRAHTKRPGRDFAENARIHAIRPRTLASTRTGSVPESTRQLRTVSLFSSRQRSQW